MSLLSAKQAREDYNKWKQHERDNDSSFWDALIDAEWAAIKYAIEDAVNDGHASVSLGNTYVGIPISNNFYKVLYYPNDYKICEINKEKLIELGYVVSEKNKISW